MSFYIAIAIGFLVSILLPGQDIRGLPRYDLVLYTLLAIGLYGSVSRIDLQEFRRHQLLIGRAITLGVGVKSILTGSAMWVIFRTPYAFLFGIIVAQIDPLSVARLVERSSKKVSEGARTILRAWSSFDDPITVLLALYVYVPLIVSGSSVFSFWGYIFHLGTNLLFALFIWFFSQRIRDNQVKLILLGVAFAIAIPLKLMLGIALVGLFVRPHERHVSLLVQVSFVIAAVFLGSLLEIERAHLIQGVTLGALAFAAQAVATRLVAPGLSRTDTRFLMLAQYNGITSVILALIVAQWIPQATSVIAFAVITINALYYGTHHLLEQKLQFDNASDTKE